MKLKAPKGVSSFSHDGEEIEIKKGMIDVEGTAVEAAMSMGFTVPGGKAAAEEEQAPETVETADPAPEQAPEQPQE